MTVYIFVHRSECANMLQIWTMQSNYHEFGGMLFLDYFLQKCNIPIANNLQPTKYCLNQTYVKSWGFCNSRWKIFVPGLICLFFSPSPFIMSCLWVDFCFESASCSHWHYQDLYENKDWKIKCFQRLQTDGTISSLLLMLYYTPWVFISYQKFYSCRDQFEDPPLNSFPLQEHCQINKK